jgi:mannosylfructose-phosphate synthase
LREIWLIFDRSRAAEGSWDNGSLSNAYQESERTSFHIALVSTHGYVASIPPLGAADTGGQVVYVLELAKKLTQLGYTVDIWTRQFEEQPHLEDVSEDVRIIRIPCGGDQFIPKEYLYRYLYEWSEGALRFIRRNKLAYDFINSHYWDAGIAGQRLAEELDVPHIHTPHSLGIWKKRQMETDYPERREDFEEEFNFSERIKHETILYRTCNAVIATTPPQLDMLVQHYEMPSSRVHMIPPGYDDNRFYPVGAASRRIVREKFGFKEPTVLALGRLATNKGYDLLIDGFSVLAERVSDVRLHIAAGGENMDEQEARILSEVKARTANLGLSDRVEFSGYVADEDLADIYRAADLFVLPSRYEPFGMTAIEAMASGTPSVVTVHGGLYRAITFGRHALFADPFDKEDLGITMMKPFRHRKLRERLSHMGAHKARSLFTWTGIAQLLVSLVESRSSGPRVPDEDDWAEPWNDSI